MFLTAATGSSQETAPPAEASTKLKTLNDHFPFSVPPTVQAWQTRSQTLKDRVLIANGLWPMPDKTPLGAVIHDRSERDGFVTEKVYFESFPGHFVTGMLFRPATDNSLGIRDGKRPGVLCPHGHGGRLLRYDDDELAELIETGGEVHENSGRSPRYARCAHLARMGCVAFVFDMLGYADSQQVSFETSHRHADPRPEENDRSRPCLYSIDADLNLQSVMGWQTWNAIRALDFLASLPDVDAERLGVTGGSGGGTQTILVGAIDPRVKVSFPNGMVSTSMQGGCYCENCNYLRVDTGNVELAALLAPRPQGMTAADDWTRDMMTDGYPELKKLYTMLGAADNVMCRALLHFPHNYNYVTRATMYPLMAKHLGLPDDVPLVEQDAELPPDEDLHVWNDSHPMPAETGIPHERRVLAWWKEQSDAKLAESLPGSGADRAAGPQPKSPLAEFHATYGTAWRAMLAVPESGRRDLSSMITILPEGKRRGTLIDCGNRETTVAEVRPFLDEGFEVVVPFSDGDGDSSVQRLVDNGKAYSAFTFGYNPTEFARRVDTLVKLIDEKSKNGQVVQLRGSGESAAWAVAAAVSAGDKVERCIVEPESFRFADVEHYSDRRFVPGAVKYGDLPVLMALRAPHALTLVAPADDAKRIVEAAYKQAGAPENLTVR